jgi:hypothetical protein
MRQLNRFLAALPASGLLLLAGCDVGPATYRSLDAMDPGAATVAAGTVAESYSVSQGNSWISIVAVDGESTGMARAVRVPAGEHRFEVRHLDPYATFYGNVKFETFAFTAAPGGRYRIDASYCCGAILGQFDLAVIDETTGQQIAAVPMSEQ